MSPVDVTPEEAAELDAMFRVRGRMADLVTELMQEGFDATAILHGMAAAAGKYAGFIMSDGYRRPVPRVGRKDVERGILEALGIEWSEAQRLVQERGARGEAPQVQGF